MSGEKRKKNGTRGHFGYTLLYFLILFSGVAIAAFHGGMYASMLKKTGKAPEWLFAGFDWFVVFYIISIFIIFFLHIIIHETGHLVFGLLSGYRFSSFRVGSLMWVKEEGKVRFKRLSIAGTGGQCLMVPPDMTDGKVPFVMFNLGGSLMNIIIGMVLLGLYPISKNTLYLPLFLQTAGIIGIAAGLMNGIPMRLGNINNDGYNTLEIGRNSEAMRAFWLQLKLNGLAAQGIRIKDMPEEWFEIPDDEKMKNSILAVIGVLVENRLMDLHKFEEAEHLINELLEKDTAIVEVHRRLLICDLIYCRLVRGNVYGQAGDLIDRRQKKFMTAMRNFLSVIRTEYALALLERKDEKEARSIREKFEKSARSFPYPSEVESERELIDIADKRNLYGNLPGARDDNRGAVRSEDSMK